MFNALIYMRAFGKIFTAKRSHLALYHESRMAKGGAHHVNVNEIAAQSMGLNDRIASNVAGCVGTMWFCYGLAVLMTAWAILQGALGSQAFDPFPYPFLFFCLGGIMQSLLMPLIMVAANLESRRSELRTEHDHEVGLENHALLTQIRDYLAPAAPVLSLEHHQALSTALHTFNQVLQDIR